MRHPWVECRRNSRNLPNPPLHASDPSPGSGPLPSRTTSLTETHPRDETAPQGRPARRRARHPLSSGNQGDGEGDAAGRRQAVDPICDRRGAGGGDRAVLPCVGPGQDGADRPFRRRLRAGGDAARARTRTDIIELAGRRCGCTPGAITTVRQQVPLGLGHAIWCARAFVGEDPFAILLPDDLVLSDTPCLKQLADAYQGDRGQRGCRDRGAARADKPVWHPEGGAG